MPTQKALRNDRPHLSVNRETTPRPFDAASVRFPSAPQLRLETHWTRALYHDFDAPGRGADLRSDAASQSGESRASAKHEAFGPRTPVIAGVLLLGFYVALYLAVSAVIRVFAHDDAVTAQPAGGGADRPESASARPRTAAPPSPAIA